MSTVFYNTINFTGSILSAPHVVGDARLVVTNITHFGTPSSSQPLRVCVGAGTSTAIYSVTGVDGSALLISGVLEGTSDQAFVAGTRVEVRITAGALRDIHDAVNYLETHGGGDTPSTVYTVAGRTGDVVLGTGDVTGLVSALASKAPLNSPALTGVPTAPTPIYSDNSSAVATTAFVKTQGYLTPSGDGSLLTGITESQVTGLVSDLGSKAPLNSPALTGVPTAPTPITSDDTTKIATTAYVRAQGFLTSLTTSDVTGLDAALAAKADDSLVVHLAGTETISGSKTFSTVITGDISGNAGTATNGVVTTGSYADPAWVTSLAASKLSGVVGTAHLGTGTASSTTFLCGDGTWATPAALTGVNVLATNGFAAVSGFTDTVENLILQATVTGLLKGDGTAMSAAVAGTDYLEPGGDGSNLTGLTQTQISGLGTALAAKAPLDSPDLTGTPTAPTPVTADNTTKIATTAYVQAQGYITTAPVTSVSGHTGVVSLVTSDVIGLDTALAAKAADAAVVHLSGIETVAGAKTFSTIISGSITGNAATATNGVVTTGSYANPAWITSVAASKLTGVVTTANLGTGTASSTTFLRGDGTWASVATNASVVSSHGFAGTVDSTTDPTTPAITLSTTVTGIVKGNGTSLSAATAGTDYLTPTGNGSGLTGLTESQVTGLTTDLAAKAADSLVVHLAGTETITGAKTFTGQTRIDSHYGAITADTDGTTITFDCSVSDKHSVTLGGNRALAFSGDQIGQTILLILTQDATGSRTITSWPSTVRWPGGSAPTLTTTASKADVLTFIKIGSSSYLGFLSGANL